MTSELDIADGIVGEDSLADAGASASLATASGGIGAASSARVSETGAKKTMSLEALTAFVEEKHLQQDKQAEKIQSLKDQRKAASAAKKAATKEIKKQKRFLAKKDQIIARRSTWSLVAELERRMEPSKSSSSS